MSKAAKPTLERLIAALRKADAALTTAIDKHGKRDMREFAARKAGRVKTRRRDPGIERAEGRAHRAINDALEALCRYRPCTPEELASYIVTLLNHWRIKDAN